MYMCIYIHLSLFPSLIYFDLNFLTKVLEKYS